MSFLDSLKRVFWAPYCFDAIISVDHECKYCFLHLFSQKDPDVIVDKLGSVFKSCFLRLVDSKLPQYIEENKIYFLHGIK